jgi:outer membrane protein assembly factor BamB
MLRSRVLLWVSVIVFPPLSLVLLWMRRDWGVFRRLAASAGILIVALAELFFFYGLRIDWNGNMTEFSVSFERRSQRYARLEESRARQQKQAPPSELPATMPVESPVPPPAPMKLRPAYWTDFRGPHRDGVYAEMEIPAEWPAGGLPMLWKQPIGAGYASFTVGEGRAYTIEQRRESEAITAYEVATGRELWAFKYPAQFEEVLGGPGPRATPVYHDGLVYSLGANGDFYCLSAQTGKPKWSKNILADNGAKNTHWGMAASPLLSNEKVIVTPGGTNGHSLVAYHRVTGERLWQSLNDRAGYTSPIVATLAGREQIVWLSAERAVGVATEDGKLLWEYPFPAQMDMNCSQPVIVDDSNVLFSSSDAGGAVLLEIVKAGDDYSAGPVWKSNRMKNKFSSSVLYKGYIYGLDESILACMEAKTGELKWKGGRYGFGQLLLAGGNLIVLTEQGDVVLVRATPESHQQLMRFPAIEGKTWNIPAIDNGLLLVRNSNEMACFRLGPGSLKK